MTGSICSCWARVASGRLRRVLLGSVSSELVRQAPCPVLVVPRSVDFDSSAGGLAGRDEAAAKS